MCFMDWRIGRLLRSNTTYAQVAVAGDLTIPPNPNRAALQLFFINTTQVTWGPLISGIAGVSYPFPSLQAPARFSLAENGDLCQQSFLIHNGSAAIINVIWVEQTAPEWLLNLGLKEFMERYPQTYK